MTTDNNNNVSEYMIGRTTYIVKLVFNPASKERLADILQRLIDRECEEMLGESGQEPEKQAV
ncbi:MAG: transposon-encoded TnpW family protein [Ruminococcus sp.]|nr:transposon-encoded TnpW family protein [Ruminococcus sp.]